MNGGTPSSDDLSSNAIAGRRTRAANPCGLHGPATDRSARAKDVARIGGRQIRAGALTHYNRLINQGAVKAHVEVVDEGAEEVGARASSFARALFAQTAADTSIRRNGQIVADLTHGAQGG